jgi:hypothetical protein
MDDVHEGGRAPAMQALATVVRQFAGSRVERQLLAQVFDLVWQTPGSAPRDAASDGRASFARVDGRRMPALASGEGGLQ